MIITNDCLEENTLTVEVGGVCVSINDIIDQTPSTDCDELMVCIGPHLVSLNDLIMDVYSYAQSAQAQNVSYFQSILAQYNVLLQFYMKCCADIIGRLTRIEKRIGGLTIVRQIVIKEPPRTLSVGRPPITTTTLVRPPVIISEERYIIDQSIDTGFVDKYIRYDVYGNMFADPYVFWLKTDEGFRRKLLPIEVPFPVGSLLAINFIEKIKAAYLENNIDFDLSSIRYKNLKGLGSFIIPKLSGRFIISGSQVFNLDGKNLNKFLPIIYNKVVKNLVADEDLFLEKVIKYRVSSGKLLMTYQVLNKKTGVLTQFEGGPSLWLKWSF